MIDPPPRARLPRLVLAALAALAPSCSLVVDDVIEQCDTDADCGEKGGEFNGAVCREGVCKKMTGGLAPSESWACVGQRPPTEPAAPEARVGLRFVDAVSGAPIVGMSVAPCGRFDVACTEPLAAPALTDAGGRAEVLVPTAATMVGVPGFAGYFLLSAEERGLVLFSIHPPLIEDFEFETPLTKLDQFIQIATLSGVSIDPTRGNAIFAGEDCLRAPAAGMTFRLEGADALAKVFYSAAGSPSTTATATDAGGLAFGTNLPSGYATLSAEHPEVGGVARLSVLARAGALSIAIIRPDH